MDTITHCRCAGRLVALHLFDYTISAWLVHTVSAGYEEIVRDLLGSGANVKLINDKGITPL